MPTCPGCDRSFAPEALERHGEGSVLRVRCPGCRTVMGVYREPGRHP